jgi:tetratricopeptide (TPR) repeat protein
MMPYHVGFDPSGNVTLSYYRERIVNRKNHPRFEGAIHEAIPPTAPVVYWDVPVQHRKIHPSDPNRNLRIFEKLLADGKTLVPREQYYYGRELCDHGRYEEAITVLSAYLEENLGWIEDKISACLKLSQCREALGQNAAALDSLMISFRYDRPRPEVCCQIGRLFLEQALLGPAIFWYETALSFPWREHRHGFIQPDSYGYIPLLQLCLCYDRLGDHKQARAYNERAGKLKPQDPSYLHNKAYFDGLLGSEGDDSQ